MFFFFSFNNYVSYSYTKLRLGNGLTFFWKGLPALLTVCSFCSCLIVFVCLPPLGLRTLCGFDCMSSCVQLFTLNITERIYLSYMITTGKQVFKRQLLVILERAYSRICANKKGITLTFFFFFFCFFFLYTMYSSFHLYEYMYNATSLCY